MNRVAGYGRIDRNIDLHFRFNDVAYIGHPGDTLASALLANGVSVVAGSVKLGRARGIGASWIEDPTGLVSLDYPVMEPMVTAAAVELVDGLVARGVNGQGRLASTSDRARYDRKYTHTDTLVIGAGIAGLLAARSAARAGESVVLVDDRAAPGGSLTGTEIVDGVPALEFVASLGAELASRGVVHLQRCSAVGEYDDGFVLAVQHRSDHLGDAGDNRRARQRVHRIRAVRIILATGAHERPIVFCDNDRPGTMLAASARDFLHRFGVLVGRRIVVFTSDDSA